MMKKNIILFVALLLGMTVSNAQDNYVPESTDRTVNAFQDMRDASFLTEQSSMSFFELSDDERAEKIDFFLAQNRKYLPKNKMETIKETLMGLNEAKTNFIYYFIFIFMEKNNIFRLDISMSNFFFL